MPFIFDGFRLPSRTGQRASQTEITFPPVDTADRALLSRKDSPLVGTRRYRGPGDEPVVPRPGYLQDTSVKTEISLPEKNPDSLLTPTSAHVEPGIFDPRSWGPKLVDWAFPGPSLDDVAQAEMGASLSDEAAELAESTYRAWEGQQIQNVIAGAAAVGVPAAAATGALYNVGQSWSDVFHGEGNISDALTGTLQAVQGVGNLFLDIGQDIMEFENEAIPAENVSALTEADIQGAWPGEFVHEFAGGPGISSNMAREIVANRNPATVGKPKLVVSAPPPEGEGWAGMGNITQDEIISQWLVQDAHPFKNPGAAEDSIRETVSRAYYLNEQFLNNPDSVSIQGVRQGIMSGRPLTVMQVSDNTGNLPTEEFMLYSSTGSPIGGKVQGQHHVIAGWANANSGDPETDRAESGWFVKGAEVMNNYGVALFQHFNELLNWQEQQGHWTGDWHGVKTGVVPHYDQFGNLQGNYKDSAFYDPGY